MKRFAVCVALFVVGCGGEATNAPGAGGASGSGGSAGTGKSGDPCAIASDCEGALVCKSGQCHAECAVSTDCEPGDRCVLTAAPDASVAVGVCQKPTESQCHFNTDCKDPLVCAPDMQCRNRCTVDRDCVTGEKCVQGVCSTP